MKNKSRSYSIEAKIKEKSQIQAEPNKQKKEQRASTKISRPKPKLDIDIDDIGYQDAKEKLAIKTAQERKNINFDDFQLPIAHQTTRSKQPIPHFETVLE